MDGTNLKDRVALVTGSSRGIGRATAMQMAEQGAAVAVNYQRQAAAAEEVVGQIEDAGGRAIAIQADVGDRSAVARMVAETAERFGPIDVLVNNAGIARFGQISRYDEDDFDAMWRTNVKGVVHCTAEVAPSMIAVGFGRIINLSSIAALGTAFPGTTLYGATKSAVLTLSKRCAFELGRHGICVNAVCPGLIATDMPFEGKTQEGIDEMISIFSERAMLLRTGEADEIANVVCFLASDKAGFITGQTITVDGGRIDYLTH